MPDTLARSQTPWALRLTPPFPAIAQRILVVAGQEDASAQRVGELIKLDPSFSADVLRYANSALFGHRREVTSLSRAIVVLGMDRIKTMATFVAVNKMVGSSIRIQALRKVWVHSLMTAIIAQEIARASGLDGEAAYTTGLLHNLGALGLMSAYPDEYTQLLEVSNELGLDLLETERDLFDIDHCAAGAHLAREWSFPEELAAAIAGHHGEPVPNEWSVGNVVRVSWRFADTLGYASFSPVRDWACDELKAFFPARRESWLYESEESAVAELEKRLASAGI